MRASFLLVLALALLVGLGVAVAVKSSGLLTPPPPVVIAPPPPVVEKKEVPPVVLVLAANRNLYESETVRPGDVKVRAAKPEELELLKANKAEFPAPVVEAAYYRFLAKNVEADQLLRRVDLSDMKRPDALNTRLAPGYRAVNISLTKSHAAGGLVQPGDWVDVYLTTEIGRTDEATSRTPHTGLVARNVQVVAKRDSLFSGFAPISPSADIPHTLAANPYRAALLEYARSVGTLSIVPVSDNEKKKLDERKKVAMADPTKPMIVAVSNVDSPEYRDEENRIRDYEKGEQAVGAEDLIKVLSLKPLAPPLSPVPPVMIENLNGTNRAGTTTFATAPPPAPKSPKYIFFPPAGPSSKSSAPQGSPLTPRNL
ncbi:MAG: Flp pilus assembly protein CpaB [Gemmataceae bacterium]